MAWVLAGLGCWVAGVNAPVLLAVLTALIALIPFGTPFVWGFIGVWSLLNGQTAAGFGLLLWGALVVSWITSSRIRLSIQLLVISSASRIPFLLAAFGLIGLFVGPVILTIMMGGVARMAGPAGAGAGRWRQHIPHR